MTAPPEPGLAILRQRARAAFQQAFGAAPALIAAAPGRVNLIGEHTDYNDGYVLPCAIGRYTLAAARPRNDRSLVVVAADVQNERAAIDLGAPIAPVREPAWSNYLRGMAALLLADGSLRQGADLLIAGDVPRGAGLSSSASLELASGLALAALSGAPIDRVRLARYGQRAEHEYAGCPCGIMDQLVSACGRSGCALLIDCRSLQMREITLPPDTVVMIVHSGISRGLIAGEYARRRQQCASAAAHFGVAALRDLGLPQLMQRAHELPPVVVRRARHVITENLRTLLAAETLERGDLELMGRLMVESHASMRDDFEITLPAVDELVALLLQAIGGEGGARMTGGGFGGAVVALMPMGRAAAVADAVRARYRTPSGAVPDIMLASAVAGAQLLE